MRSSGPSVTNEHARTDGAGAIRPDAEARDDAGAQLRLHSADEWRRAHARLFRDQYDPETTREVRERIRRQLSSGSTPMQRAWIRQD